MEAGIEVNPNGTIKIRGQQAVLAPSEALVVIDGVICDNINTINSNQVHSVQVLKDAGSTAIYGSRGGDGVVLITTKMADETEQAQIEAVGDLQGTRIRSLAEAAPGKAKQSKDGFASRIE